MADLLLKFPAGIMDAIVQTVPRATLEASRLHGLVRVSTHFSGMGTAETALHLLEKECVRHNLGFKVAVLSSCDSDAQCRPGTSTVIIIL